MTQETTRRAERVATDLRHVYGVLSRRLRAESAESELSPTEQAVLRRLLADGPATTAALARAEWVKPQSMGATLAALEEGGFVTRSVDAADARCRTIAITDKGRRVIAAGRAARQTWLARAIEQTLAPDEQRALESAIALLRRVVES